MSMHEAEYEEFRRVVGQMADGRDEHTAESPDCASAPMCLGPDQMKAFFFAIGTDPTFSTKLALAAIGELCAYRKLAGELQAAVDLKGAAYADEAAKVFRMEMDLAEAHALLADAEALLTAYQEADDER